MTKLEQAARQALGALVRAEAMYGQPNADIQTALREALAEQAEQEPVIRATLAPPAPPEVYQMRSRDAFEAGWWEAQRQKAVSPISPVQQAEQEPVMGYERLNALREGEQNGAEDAYFFVRPENDTPTLRKMFCQGFERGFHKGLKYTAPVRTKDLTDDEIMKINVDTAGIVPTCDRQFHFARAVIAADREKNK